MAKTSFKSVDEYIATHPPGTQAVLKRVRAAIRKALPAAEESISYQIPTYKQGGRCVVYFAGWKQHYSLYPVSAGVLAAFRGEFMPYEVEKGTIRFPLAKAVPTKLIAGIAKHLAKDADQRALVRRGRAKTRRASR